MTLNNLKVANVADEVVVFFFGRGWHNHVPFYYAHAATLSSQPSSLEFLNQAIARARGPGDVSRVIIKAPARYSEVDYAVLAHNALRRAFPGTMISLPQYYLPQLGSSTQDSFVQDFFAYPVDRNVGTILRQARLIPGQPAVATVVGLPCVASDISDQAVIFFFGRHAHDAPLSSSRDPWHYITVVKFPVLAANVQEALELAFRQIQGRGIVYHVAVRVPEHDDFGVAGQIEQILSARLPCQWTSDVQSYAKAGPGYFTAFQGTRRVERNGWGYSPSQRS